MVLHILAIMVAGLLGLMEASPLLASEEQPPPTSGSNERLDRAFGSEAGVQVYMDPEGNVGTVLDPSGGGRRFTAQSPQSPSINLSPPLQLHNPPSDLPQPALPALPVLLPSPPSTR